MKNSQSNLLKIAETDIRFVGKGLALLDPKVMDETNLELGDVIELKGKRKVSYVRLWSGLPSDYNRNIIRIDGYTRNTLDSGIDDHVTIKKIGNVNLATEVNLVPYEDLEYSGFKEAYSKFIGRPCCIKNGYYSYKSDGKKDYFYSK